MYPDQGLLKVWLGVAKHTVHHNLDLVFTTPKLIERRRGLIEFLASSQSPEGRLGMTVATLLHRNQKTWCQICETKARAQLSVSDLVNLVKVDVG